jgi:hypothetical protein
VSVRAKCDVCGYGRDLQRVGADLTLREGVAKWIKTVCPRCARRFGVK